MSASNIPPDFVHTHECCDGYTVSDDVVREPHGFAAGDGEQLVLGNALFGHQPDRLVRADDRRAGPPRDPLGAPQVVEVGVADQDPVGPVDVVGGESRARRAGRAIDVRIEEHDEIADRQPESRAAVPVERRGHPGSIARGRGSVPERPMAADPFDPYAPSSDERYAAMAQIRASGGIVETPAGYYVATAEGVATGLHDVEKFVGSFMDTSALPEDDVMISAIPEPRHGRIRRVINTVVAAHRTMQNEPFIRARALGLVDRVLVPGGDGTVDLVAVFDSLPSIVIAHMLGVPADFEDRFRAWSDELLEAQNAEGTGSLSDAHPEFVAFVQQLIDDHRAMDDPPDDVVTRFINTDVDGEYLSDRAIRTQIMFLIVAGNETTRNLIGNCLYVLATRPDLLSEVQEDPSRIPAFVEESLRLDAPVQVLARAVLGDTEIVGRPLHPGERVVFGVASANRDEAVYDDPTEFRLDRARMREHLAFGTGPHVCPGASLARLEAIAVLEAFAPRGALRLADDYTPDPNPVFWANGHRSLRVWSHPRPDAIGARVAHTNRAGEKSPMSSGGARPLTTSATTRPVTGPSSSPFAPWPLATIMPSTPGSRPISGRSSSLVGRRPTLTSRNVASPSPGQRRRPSEKSRRNPLAVGRASKPTSSTVAPSARRPSGHGTT